MVNKKDEQKKREFIAFLKKNNALIPFVCNLANGIDVLDGYEERIQKRSLTQFFNEMKKKTRMRSSWVNYAFTWSKTPEEFMYWDGINAKWHEQCRK